MTNNAASGLPRVHAYAPVRAAAFDTIDAEYGSLEGYFSAGLGLGKPEFAALEARYLEA